MELPARLGELAGTPAGRDWLAALPRLLAECAERWELRAGAPFPGSNASLTVAATRADGSAAVLKLQFPHRESEHEAAALALWDGDGAARLLAHDLQRHALLLERCEPGTPLAEVGQEAALDAAVELLPRLWRPAGTPFRPAADEAGWWADTLPAEWEAAGRPFERALLDAALGLLRELPGSQGDQVLVHQDLHAGNVLAARRQPWLAIDPKPLAGERELGIAALVRGRELGGEQRDVRRRLDRLSGELGLDRERARGWAIAQSLAWSIDGGHVYGYAVECARGLLAA